MTCEIACVPTRLVGEVWPRVAALLELAIEKLNLGDYEVMEQELRDGKALLWIAGDPGDLKSAGVTQVSLANGRKFCTIVAWAGHDVTTSLPLLCEIDAYAKREGCVAMRIFGRPGWSRVLKDYDVIGHILERTLP